VVSDHVPGFLIAYADGRAPTRADAEDLRQSADLWDTGTVIPDRRVAGEVAAIMRDAADWIDANIAAPRELVRR
jgi:hypothetical protein